MEMLALKRKASSERGASITFALLLFLVCAIISSIVIVAATAVGGRASKMAEMDRRYYAVNSAAELLRDVLEAPVMTVETGTQEVTPIILDKDMNQISTGATETKSLDTVITMDDGTGSTTVANSDTSLLTVAALNLADGINPRPAMPTGIALTAAASDEELDTAGLNVTVTPPASIVNDQMVIDVANADKTKGTAYTLRLTFKANTTKSTDSQTTYGAKSPVIKDGKIVADQYTMDRTLVNKNITTVRWKLVDLVTVGVGTESQSAGE